MTECAPYRRCGPEGDLADARQYTSFWWQPGDSPCFGFVLTPRQGQTLRRLLQERCGARTCSTPRSTGRLYDGEMEVVSATIPGEIDEEIVVAAHLCHPQTIGQRQRLRVLRRLWRRPRAPVVDRQRQALPARERTIRFLWLPEINGMYAYLADRESELGQLVAGINLDMVGEDQNQTGSSWLIERPPDAAASFAPDLLVRLRDELSRLKGMSRRVSPATPASAAIRCTARPRSPSPAAATTMSFPIPSSACPRRC